MNFVYICTDFHNLNFAPTLWSHPLLLRKVLDRDFMLGSLFLQLANTYNIHENCHLYYMKISWDLTYLCDSSLCGQSDPAWTRNSTLEREQPRTLRNFSFTRKAWPIVTWVGHSMSTWGWWSWKGCTWCVCVCVCEREREREKVWIDRGCVLQLS